MFLFRSLVFCLLVAGCGYQDLPESAQDARAQVLLAEARVCVLGFPGTRETEPDFVLAITSGPIFSWESEKRGLHLNNTNVGVISRDYVNLGTIAHEFAHWAIPGALPGEEARVQQIEKACGG